MVPKHSPYWEILAQAWVHKLFTYLYLFSWIQSFTSVSYLLKLKTWNKITIGVLQVCTYVLYKIHDPNKFLKFFRYRWYTEVGFTQRGLTRFSYSLPKCSNSGGGFNSIGLTDVDYVIIFFAFGIGFSFFCLIVEKIYHLKKNRNVIHVKESKVRTKLMAQHNMQFFTN